MTRGVDPDELERARMETMHTGYDSGDKPLLNVCADVSFQELATRVSHRNAGRLTDEPIAEKLLTRVARDENLHMIFFRKIVQAALEAPRCQAMRVDHAGGQELPGAGVDHRRRRAQGVADGVGRHLRPAHPPR